MAQDITQYPFIGSTGVERGGVMNNPSLNAGFYTAPTLNLSSFNNAISAGFANVAPGGKLVNMANGVAYAIPVFKNA